MTPIALREATAADAPLIRDLIVAAFEEYRAWLVPPSSAVRETSESVGARLVQGGAFLAHAAEVPVGAVLFACRPEALWLGRLSVLPAWRGYGIGALLVAAVEARAQALGYATVRLGVRLSLSQNRTYYERRGYAIIEYHTHDGSPAPTWITLEKRLALPESAG